MFLLHQYTCQRYINKVPSLLILVHFLVLFILILKSFNKRLEVFRKVRSCLPLFRNERVDMVLFTLQQLLCTDHQMAVQIWTKHSQNAAHFPCNGFCMLKRCDFLLRRGSCPVRLKKYYFSPCRRQTSSDCHSKDPVYLQRPADGLSATAPRKIHPLVGHFQAAWIILLAEAHFWSSPAPGPHSSFLLHASIPATYCGASITSWEGVVVKNK